MIERYRLTAERIRQELGALERVVSRLKRAMRLAQERPAEQDLYLDAVALNLHDFYTGLERAFQQIAARVDESVPSGADWHQSLLKQMSIEKPGRRPAVVSTKTYEGLEEYLRFRHVVRNVYAFEFDPGRLERLVQNLEPLFRRTHRELNAFAGFLDQLACNDEGGP